MTTNTLIDAKTPRMNFAKAAPRINRAIVAFDAAAREGLDPALVELVQIRASLLNNCAYCLHMHTNDARKAGESEDRLHLVAVWREAVDVHFPGQAWLRVRRETFDRLSVYRGRHGLTSMDDALDRLLGEDER